MHQHPQGGVGYVASDEEEQNDGNQHDNQQERRAAARVQGRELLGVLGRQGKVVLMAVDSLVFRTVVLERAAHIRHHAAENHVRNQNQHFRQAADQRRDRAGRAQRQNPFFRQRRQDDEQPDAQQHRQHHRHAHDDLVNALAELRREPLLKFRRLFLFRAEHLRGRFQRRHAHREHVDHVDRAADDGQPHPLVLLAERLGLLVVHYHRLVWAAHRDGNRVRPLHHDAFENSLSANIDGLLGLIWHNNTSFCACARTMQSSRRKAENPPPSYIRDKRARFLQRRREKRNKEGLTWRRTTWYLNVRELKERGIIVMNDLQVVEQELSDAIMPEM